MEHDPAEDEVQELLSQPMGDVAKEVAHELLQSFRKAALDAVRLGTTPDEREAGVRRERQRLLGCLREFLPPIIGLEERSTEAIREAQDAAERAYRSRFEGEVARTLEDPDFDRPVAERVARAELHFFRRELERVLAGRVAAEQQALLEAVESILRGG